MLVLRSKPVQFPVLVFGLALLLRCAPNVQGGIYNIELSALASADSLFKAGNYEYAKAKYGKIRSDNAQTKVGARAQYKLAYINTYYDNPFADYSAALREFKLFTSTYPDDAMVEVANNWIRMLTVLKNYDKAFHGSTSELKELERNKKTVFGNYARLQDAYFKCDSKVDSLRNRVGILEGVIAELDKVK